MTELLFDHYGNVDWKVVGVAAFFSVVLPLRAWAFLQPQNKKPKVISAVLVCAMSIVGGCVLFYLENQMDGFPFGEFKLIDLLPAVLIAYGLFMLWDIFIRTKDFSRAR
jgi:hypothetical protein